MKIYFTRYGETQWNALNKICGLTDIDLTEKGISQAGELAEKTVLCVCHGGVCRVANTYFKDMTNDEYFHYSLENCGLEEYEL